MKKNIIKIIILTIILWIVFGYGFISYYNCNKNFSGISFFTITSQLDCCPEGAMCFARSIQEFRGFPFSHALILNLPTFLQNNFTFIIFYIGVYLLNIIVYFVVSYYTFRLIDKYLKNTN